MERAEDLSERLSGIERQLATLVSLMEKDSRAAETFQRHCFNQLDGVMHWLNFLIQQSSSSSKRSAKEITACTDYLQDLLLGLQQRNPAPLGWRFTAERTVADDSTDHLHPRGTINDNTRHPRFVRACETVIGETCLRHLDIGCAGGGLVWDFTMRGHHSVGIEGSDLSLREQRAAWRLLPDRLFTADIRYRYAFTDAGGAAIGFDVVTAWEVFEHIDTDRVDAVLSQIRHNLKPGGRLVASISKVDDRDAANAVSWHKTIEDERWWHAKLAENGFAVDLRGWETGDFVRGVGNARADDWDVRVSPGEGFHVVAVKTRD